MSTTKTKKVSSRKKRVTSKNPTLKYQKRTAEATEPQYATNGSACFDLFSCFPDDGVNIFNAFNEPRRREVVEDGNEVKTIYLNPGDRAMIPTGLIFDIPEGHYVRLFSRSGHSIRLGLVLSNGVGVIDSDYTDEIIVILHNTSNTVVAVRDQERLCQGILEQYQVCSFEETEKVESKKTRSGGFGSTGTGELDES